MIVMKFGGSSVESAKAIQRVASIVEKELDRNPVVVVSAMGKTTDRLLSIAQMCAAGKREYAFWELMRLREFHGREASACLGSMGPAKRLDQALCRHFEELEQLLNLVAEEKALTPVRSDAVLSFGERLSSLIVTAALQHRDIDAVHLDARAAIITDDHHTCAVPRFVETNALLRRRVSREKVTVMGGFIGSTEDGVTTTLGRGGSDYSAAIAGAALAAEEIQIWTDVDGILTCDPRVVPAAHCLKGVSYIEAEQMARAGARVLHPATVLPAIRQRIPIVIRNSRNEFAAGTRITGDCARTCEGEVLSIACKAGMTLMHVRPPHMHVNSEFGRTIWEILQESGITFELISPAMREFSLVVESAALTPEFLTRLGSLAETEIENGRALITLIGRNATRNTLNVVRASQRLAPLNCGAMLTCCTDSRFAFIVDTKSLEPAANALHEEFFSHPDPATFVRNRYISAPVKVTGRESTVPATVLRATPALR
jgi:aspartate kinase